MNTIFGLNFFCLKFNDILKTCKPKVDFFFKIIEKIVKNIKN